MSDSSKTICRCGKEIDKLYYVKLCDDCLNKQNKQNKPKRCDTCQNRYVLKMKPPCHVCIRNQAYNDNWEEQQEIMPMG